MRPCQILLVRIKKCMPHFERVRVNHRNIHESSQQFFHSKKTNCILCQAVNETSLRGVVVNHRRSENDRCIEEIKAAPDTM